MPRCKLFLCVLSLVWIVNLATARPSLSSQLAVNRNHSGMTSPSASVISHSNTDASALRELKEIIKRQAAEIESLKRSAKASSNSAACHGAHGGAGGEDEVDVGSYLGMPFYRIALKRVGWLSIFLVSLSMTAVIMNGFEHTLSQQIELAYFVPLLAGHGGNTGGQTVGTVLSAMSVGAVTTRDAFRVVSKEALSGMTVGLMLGSLLGPAAYFLGGISPHVSTVVFCTLPLLSTIAGLLASSIPLACKCIGVDPAVISAPAMTTFVDVSGLLSYFLIANRVFKWYGLEL